MMRSSDATTLSSAAGPSKEIPGPGEAKNAMSETIVPAQHEEQKLDLREEEEDMMRSGILKLKLINSVPTRLNSSYLRQT